MYRIDPRSEQVFISIATILFTMSTSSLLLTLLTAFAAAYPSRGTQHLATFDDLTSNPLLPEATPVGDYMGLQWGGYVVTSTALVPIPPVQPQSGKQVAANGAELGPMSITTDSKTKAFTPESLYFGCLANTGATVASVPETCTLAFTAYRGDFAFETINESFQPTNAVSSKMVKVEFPLSFSGLTRMDVAVVSSADPEAITGVSVDSVSYITY